MLVHVSMGTKKNTRKITGRKLTLFTGSHLAPKFVKVVANSKKSVAIMRHTQKTLSTFQLISTTNAIKICTSYEEDTRMGHIQRER